MKVNLLSKLSTAFITSILFAVTISLFFKNESYDFMFYFVIFSIFGSLAIFLVGLPLSILIDRIISRLTSILNYRCLPFLSFILYILFGYAGTLIFFWLVLSVGPLKGPFEEAFTMGIYGVAAALMFMLVDIVVKKIISGKRT